MCERDRHNKTEWKSSLKKIRKMYQITRLLTHLRKLLPKIIPPLLENRNERYHTGGLLRGGLYKGVLIHGATQVLRKRWAYLGLIGGNVQYIPDDWYMRRKLCCFLPGKISQSSRVKLF